MSNFKFLQQEWFSLYSKLKTAEERVFIEPVSAASYCRLVLEESMYLIYDLEHIDKPFNTELINLMNEEAIKSIIPFQLHEGLHIVRKTGNNAAHYGNRIYAKDALISIRYIYDFTKWLAQTYSAAIPNLPGVFNEAFIPKLGEKQRLLKEQQQEQEKAYQQLQEQIAKLQKEKEEKERRDKEEQAKKAFEKKESEEKKEENGEKKAEDDEDKGPVPVGNGGTTDKYTWTQTLEEVK